MASSSIRVAKHSPVTRDVIRELQSMLQNSEVRTAPEDLICYSTDASLESQVRPGRPDIVVIPGVRGDVASIVRFAAGKGIAVTPRGAGTGMTAGAVATAGGIVVDLSRLNEVVEIDTDNLQVICEPGVVHARFNQRLKPFNLFFPPDPGSTKMCTVGGMVANNSCGMRAVKYGSTGDYVLGLEVVLPSGETITTGTIGSKALQSASGLSLTQLFVGSEGLLGIITLLRLKVLPIPQARGVVLAAYDQLDAAGESVIEALHSGIIPSAIEILDSSAISVANKYKPGLDLPDVEAILFFELDGNLAGVEDDARRLSDLASKRASRVEWSSDPKRVGALWQARSVLGAASGLAKPGGTRVAAGEDICVPIVKVPETLRAVREISQKRDTAIVTYGHIAGGNLHTALVVDTSHQDEIDRAELAADDIHALALRMGGTVTGEHGVGVVRRKYMELEHGPALSVMRAIKQAIDPAGIMNPGKVLPDPRAN